MKCLSRILQLAGLIVIAVWMIPGRAASIANAFKELAASIDPSGCFLRFSVHHVAQLILTILFMKVFSDGKLSEWGFNLRESKLSLRIFGWFCLIYLLPVFLYNVLPTLISGHSPQFNYPLTPRNVAGTLGFQFFLSGTCEEPLFRGFVMVCLAQSWKGIIRMGGFSFPISGLWATLIFMLAHANISFVPFSISASFWQQVWSLGLGLYYAAVFHRTGSLLAPILSHGYSNGVVSLALYSMASLMR